MKLRFQGYSDDTFGEYESTNEDHDNCGSGKPMQFLVTAPSGDRLLVFGQYCPGAADGWLIGVARCDPNNDDDQHMPDWPMRFERGERSYSPSLVIEAPDGCTVQYVAGKSADSVSFK